MSIPYSTISFDKTGPIASITIRRPERRNALNPTLVQELTQAFKAASADEDIRVVRLLGDGEAFSAGADLEYLQSLQTNSYEENLADSRQLANLFHEIYSCPKITIAELHGHAIAGGCGLATVTDFTFAVPEALLGYTEVKIGFIPAIVSVYLSKKVPENIAKRLLLTGELISAEEAQKLGLVTKVVDRTLIENHVEEFALKLAKETSPNSIAATKSLLHQIDGLTISEGVGKAVEANATARASEDCKRGIAAFLAKEKIVWSTLDAS